MPHASLCRTLRFFFTSSGSTWIQRQPTMPNSSFFIANVKTVSALRVEECFSHITQQWDSITNKSFGSGKLNFQLTFSLKLPCCLELFSMKNRRFGKSAELARIQTHRNSSFPRKLVGICDTNNWSKARRHKSTSVVLPDRAGRELPSAN